MPKILMPIGDAAETMDTYYAYFRLPEDATAGATAFPSLESPWPVQEEEQRMKEAWGDGCAAAGH